MDSVGTFLESSSIHGLAYISTSRKFAKVFWIIIVFGGFTFAGYMINNSINSWAERPIKTTLETRPISEIKLPKVTVCPPKNTFTDLNYDLMLAENITVTDEMRQDFYNYAVKLVDEQVYMNDIDKLQEEDRFYNWYHGYSKRSSAETHPDGTKVYVISSSAISGVITTQYYGEQYQTNLVELALYYHINVYPPESVRNNTNVTLHFKLEKHTITGLPKGMHDNIMVETKSLDEGLTSVTLNFTPPAGAGNARFMRLARYIPYEIVRVNEMKLMPGFRLSWHYSGLSRDMAPYKRFYNYKDSDNKQFRRYQIKNKHCDVLVSCSVQRIKKNLYLQEPFRNP